MRALRRWTKSTSPHSPQVSSIKPHERQSQNIPHMFDDDGRVLATSGLVAPHPWEVEPSAKYPGFFYFYNTVTSEAAWSLDVDLFKNPDHTDKDSSKLPSLDGRGPRADFTGDVVMLSTPDGCDLLMKNAVQNQQGNRRNDVVFTVENSSRSSFDDPSSDLSAPSKPLAYPMASTDGTSSVEVLAGLGAGGYACVCLVKPAGRRSNDEELMAMKVVSKMRNKRPKDKKRLQTELKLMRDVAPSRFLQRCHAAFESATDVFFVCDYLAGGDLFSHMVKRMESGKGPFSEDQARNVLAEVTLGLAHLHERGFIHRDLKAENLMLDQSGRVKIIDFGLAVEITSSTGQVMSPTGSLCYMPPELVKSGEKSGGRHTDWWAMGVLAYELMTGQSPWSSLRDKVVIRHEILNCKVYCPSTLSLTAQHFIERLLEMDFHQRLGFEDDDDVMLACFFNRVDWPAVERGDTPAPIKLDSFGPDAVTISDIKNAIDTYANKIGQPTSSFFSEVGKFGVKSPFFVGVDVITSHPKISAESLARRR